MSSQKRQPDILLCAHIAINLAPGLSGNARRVAGALLGHWNRRTGRCDPSVERIAGMLGIDRATVLRATAELCTGEHRLFDKASHGGKMNRAAYAPRWDALRDIVADWNERMATGAAPEKVAKVRRSTSQNCDVDGRRTATQTYRRNLSKEPVAVSAPPPPPVEPPAKKPEKRPEKRRRETGQGWLLLPLPGMSQQAAQAAQSAAERRVMQDLHRKGTEVYLQVCEAATSAMMDEAAAAEQRRHGTGVEMLIASVGAEKRRAAS